MSIDFKVSTHRSRTTIIALSEKAKAWLRRNLYNVYAYPEGPGYQIGEEHRNETVEALRKAGFEVDG